MCWPRLGFLRFEWPGWQGLPRIIKKAPSPKSPLAAAALTLNHLIIFHIIILGLGGIGFDCVEIGNAVGLSGVLVIPYLLPLPKRIGGYLIGAML